MYDPLRCVTFLVVAGVLALPATGLGDAQPDFWGAVNASRQLFEAAEYSQALAQLEQAKPWAQSEEQRATASLYKGLIHASLGRRYQARATSAFRRALLLDPWAQLPARASASVERQFEEARESVRKGLSSRTPGVAAPPGPAPAKGRRENFGDVLKLIQEALKGKNSEQASQFLTRARPLVRNKEHNVTLALYEGVILASLGEEQMRCAGSAFQEGLLQNQRVKLPVKSSAAVERDFEETRARVLHELSSRPKVPTEDTSRWKAAAAMSKAREAHTATLLISGSVLIAGGADASSALSDAELYNPQEGTWSSTDSMGTARYNHTAIRLRTGLVLVVGGENEEGVLSSAELYDPNLGTWSQTGPLGTGRKYHTATLLSSGQVLVTGGEDDSGEKLSSAELYDPSTGLWTATTSLSTPRIYHEAGLLKSGRVLVTGGMDSSGYLASAEEYDPDQKKWTPCKGSLPIAVAEHKATLLQSGEILITGGDDGTTGQQAMAIYNPSTGTFSPGPALMNTGRVEHTAILLNSGNVLVAGGEVTDKPTSINAEVYNVIAGKWTPTATMLTPRARCTATLLPSGEVLIVGGSHDGTPLDSVEVYQP